MGQLDNLTQSELPAILRRLDKLERATPTNNSAIGRDGLLVYNGGVITIENGGLNVTGTATITGTLQADGTIAFTGTLTQSGPSTFTGNTTVAGNLNVNGPMKTTGTLSVEGVTTLKNDLNVTTGKVKAGGMTMDPSVASGALVFSNGAQVFTDATSIQVYKGTSVVQVENGTARVQGDGSHWLKVDANGVTIGGLPTTTQPANLHQDPATGRVYRSTAA
ncbi:hypothetical protein [Arthrobacter sp. PAMC25284]|uniref:hypothetical protein n=1 Tax=Arthrobacter sp. PAMC25284 TaxID=2861279 RepID=UPI001C633B09|nr:hypothetical protein [Arthrobacter sp. PAMC25284]QYF89708.1 hypothetical protein KY499_17055 [Arthrobacter sp. PAMC25284]